MAKLRATRELLRGVPHAKTTARSYAGDWKCFASWCSGAGHKSLPAASETIALYVIWLLTEDGKRTATCHRHLASIADSHRRASLPVPSMADAREVISAVKRQRREQPRRKTALSVEDLVRVVESCDLSTAIGVRDRAVILMGFATSLRRSELSALQLSDVGFAEDGLTVYIPYSKTDQEAKGRLLAVWAGERAVTDPIAALKAWIERRGEWEGPLFCRIQTGDRIAKSRLNGEALCHVLKRAVARIGMDASSYGGHSLRAGSITASADLGRSDQELMKLSGHKSAKVLKMYVRDTGLFRGRNPLAGVL